MTIDQGEKMLREQGLNLFAVLASAALPEAFHTAARDAGVASRDYPSLVLIGHAGNAMWRRLTAASTGGRDPVDAYSTLHSRRFLEQCLPGCRHVFVYPGPMAIPLQQLGESAGWHYASPLGVGVHPHYGPWFGYRAAVLVDQELAVTPPVAGNSPCSRCRDKPCITACPAAALSAAAPPHVPACVDYRVAPGSPCAHRCSARLACPVGGEHRYDSGQLEYYYGRSLESILAYMTG